MVRRYRKPNLRSGYCPRRVFRDDRDSVLLRAAARVGTSCAEVRAANAAARKKFLNCIAGRYRVALSKNWCEWTETDGNETTWATRLSSYADS